LFITDLGKAHFSRRYFFSLAVAAMAIISSYFWASFPFDNLCEIENATSTEFTGLWSVTLGNHTEVNVLVSSEEPVYKFCLQDFFQLRSNYTRFPFVSRNQPGDQRWMTDEQEAVANICGWVSVGVVAVVLMSLLWTVFLRVLKQVRGSYKPPGRDRGVPYSRVPVISSYVPQVHSSMFPYPLLACSLKALTDGEVYRLLDWSDPDRPHAFYDLTIDANVLLRGTSGSREMNVFSKIQYWPPSNSIRSGANRREDREESGVFT
jgi:hypothetical protein